MLWLVEIEICKVVLFCQTPNFVIAFGFARVRLYLDTKNKFTQRTAFFDAQTHPERICKRIWSAKTSPK